MGELEQLMVLFVAAVILAAVNDEIGDDAFHLMGGIGLARNGVRRNGLKRPRARLLY
jgi:hypothetical protein